MTYLLQEEPVPLAFFVRGEAEVISNLGSCVKALGVETEQVLPVVYQPQAVFRVRAVTRCTSTLQGHTEAVISTAFSPTGKWVTLRYNKWLPPLGRLFPQNVDNGKTCWEADFKKWVSIFFCLRYLASGSGDTTVRFWDLMTETPHHTARGMKSHRFWLLKIQITHCQWNASELHSTLLKDTPTGSWASHGHLMERSWLQGARTVRFVSNTVFIIITIMF